MYTQTKDQKIEKIVRSNFSKVSSEGMGFLDTNIDRAIEQLKSALKSSVFTVVESGGRSTGKTTRLIDYTVQQLFDGKKIYFPTKAQVERDNIDSYREFLEKTNIHNTKYWKKQNTIVAADCDILIGQSQEQFMRRLFSRLEIEHGLTLRNKIAAYNGLLILQLSDFKGYGDK